MKNMVHHDTKEVSVVSQVIVVLIEYIPLLQLIKFGSFFGSYSACYGFLNNFFHPKGLY